MTDAHTTDRPLVVFAAYTTSLTTMGSGGQPAVQPTGYCRARPHYPCTKTAYANQHKRTGLTAVRGWRTPAYFSEEPFKGVTSSGGGCCRYTRPDYRRGESTPTGCLATWTRWQRAASQPTLYECGVYPTSCTPLLTQRKRWFSVFSGFHSGTGGCDKANTNSQQVWSPIRTTNTTPAHTTDYVCFNVSAQSKPSDNLPYQLSEQISFTLHPHGAGRPDHRQTRTQGQQATNRNRNQQYKQWCKL